MKPDKQCLENKSQGVFQPERFPTSRSNSAPPPDCHWDHVNMLLHLDCVGGAALIPFEACLPLLSQAC